MLMAVHNGLEYLPEQVESILQQRSVVLDLWFSDDNSDDGSFEWCCDLASRTSNVHALTNDGSFGSASKNFFRLLRDVPLDDYDFIAFADQDDIWELDKLFLSIRELRENRCDGVSSDVTAFWPDGTRKLIVKSQRQRAFDYLLESAGPGCTYLMRKELALDIVAWISNHSLEKLPAHDWLIYAFCRTRGYRWHIIPKSTVMYRQHSGNFLGANYGLSGKFRRLQSIRSGEFRADMEQVCSLIEQSSKIKTSRLALLIRWRHLRRDGLEGFAFLLMCVLFW